MPENAASKSLSASSPNSDLSMAEGALNPEFEVGEVNASDPPFRSAGEPMGLSAGTMISIS